MEWTRYMNTKQLQPIRIEITEIFSSRPTKALLLYIITLLHKYIDTVLRSLIEQRFKYCTNQKIKPFSFQL